MGNFLVFLLATVVVGELFVVIGIAAALFWLGATEAVAVAAGMILVSAVAGLLALRTMRPQR